MDETKLLDTQIGVMIQDAQNRKEFSISLVICATIDICTLTSILTKHLGHDPNSLTIIKKNEQFHILMLLQ